MVGTMGTSRENTTKSQNTYPSQDDYPRFDYREPPHQNESWQQFLVRHESDRRKKHGQITGDKNAGTKS